MDTRHLQRRKRIARLAASAANRIASHSAEPMCCDRSRWLLPASKVTRERGIEGVERLDHIGVVEQVVGGERWVQLNTSRHALLQRGQVGGGRVSDCAAESKPRSRIISLTPPVATVQPLG